MILSWTVVSLALGVTMRFILDWEGEQSLVAITDIMYNFIFYWLKLAKYVILL